MQRYLNNVLAAGFQYHFIIAHSSKEDHENQKELFFLKFPVSRYKYTCISADVLGSLMLSSRLPSSLGRRSRSGDVVEGGGDGVVDRDSVNLAYLQTNHSNIDITFVIILNSLTKPNMLGCVIKSINYCDLI